MRPTQPAAPATAGGEVTQQANTTSATSLRSRWNRSFAVLLVVIAGGTLANFAGTRVLVGTFRNTAERVENETTLLAHLRTDIVSHGLVLSELDVEADVDKGPRLESSIRAAFGQAIAKSRGSEARQLLQQASDRWQSMVSAAAPFAGAALFHEREEVVDVGAAEVLAQLDQAGEAGRTAALADLARGARFERAAMAAKAILVLLMSALMIRFGRRLSAEVLRPLGLLRDSANRLAAGELDHRVELNRTDELGDLAVSFNAMADAIAGSQRSLIRQANHDSLTGLANRAALYVRLEAALARPERREDTQAILFVDLDDFKDVNDTLGHAAGDELLCVAAARLHDAVRPGDLVARLGGDEFAVLFDGVPDATLALSIAERAVAALAAPVEISGTWVHVGASAGLAMRHHDSDPDSLMREADQAMYTAKGRGKNRVACHDATINDALLEHHALEAELAEAVGRGEPSSP